MALLTPRQVGTAGSAPAPVAASAGGDTVTNTKAAQLFVRVANGGGGAITVTVASPVPCNQGGTHPLAVAIPAGQARDIGPLPARRFGSVVALTYSGVATVTVDPYLT